MSTINHGVKIRSRILNLGQRSRPDLASKHSEDQVIAQCRLRPAVPAYVRRARSSAPRITGLPSADGVRRRLWRWASDPANVFTSGRIRATERAGLAHGRVHDLDHTFGRRLRAAGVSFEDRQNLLGHRSGRITTMAQCPCRVSAATWPGSRQRCAPWSAPRRCSGRWQTKSGSARDCAAER